MIKRVLFLTVGILSLLLAACETKAINNDKKGNKMKTIELTKSDFLKKIVNYETYLATRLLDRELHNYFYTTFTDKETDIQGLGQGCRASKWWSLVENQCLSVS